MSVFSKCLFCSPYLPHAHVLITHDYRMAYCVLYVSVAELALRVLPRLEVRDRSRYGNEQVYNDHGEREPRKTTKGYDMRVVDI